MYILAYWMTEKILGTFLVFKWIMIRILLYCWMQLLCAMCFSWLKNGNLYTQCLNKKSGKLRSNMYQNHLCLIKCNLHYSLYLASHREVSYGCSERGLNSWSVCALPHTMIYWKQCLVAGIVLPMLASTVLISKNCCQVFFLVFQTLIPPFPPMNGTWYSSIIFPPTFSTFIYISSYTPVKLNYKLGRFLSQKDAAELLLLFTQQSYLGTKTFAGNWGRSPGRLRPCAQRFARGSARRRGAAGAQRRDCAPATPLRGGWGQAGRPRPLPRPARGRTLEAPRGRAGPGAAPRALIGGGGHRPRPEPRRGAAASYGATVPWSQWREGRCSFCLRAGGPRFGVVARGAVTAGTWRAAVAELRQRAPARGRRSGSGWKRRWPSSCGRTWAGRCGRAGAGWRWRRYG